MPNNRKMLGVFPDAGFEVSRRFDAGTVEVSFDDRARRAESVAVQHDREHLAEARSIARLLAPRSIAVVGASRAAGDDRPRGAPQPARAAASPVRSTRCNPTATSVAGVRAYPTVADIPDQVDLAVVAVPAAAVPEVVEDCARSGVQGLVVISAGFAEVGGEHGTSSTTRRARPPPRHAHDRARTAWASSTRTPTVAMNATFAPFPRCAGGSASRRSRAGSASSCSPVPDCSASASRPSCRSATRPTSAATTCSSTGRTTPTPT